MNPHVTCQDSWVPGARQCPLADNKKEDVTLGVAIQYADYFKTSYESAVGDQAKLVSLTGVTLIPLAASAIGLGLTSGHDNTITMLGLMSATGYGTSRWLQSQPRQLVYIKGITAMNCAVDAVLPLNLSPDQTTALRQNLKELATAIHEVEDRLGQQAQGSFPDIRRRLEEARTVWGKGTRLEYEVYQAGLTLISAVDRINTEVDKALVETEPKLDDLDKIIMSLAQTTASFTAVPPKTERKSPGVGSTGVTVAAAKTAQQELEERADAMDAKKWQVEKLISIVAETVATKDLSKCGVKKDQLPSSGIVVEPSSLTFTQGAEATKSLQVSGGKGEHPHYSTQLLGDGVVGLNVTELKPLGATVQVRVTKNIPAADYQLYITDGVQNGRIVTITVK